MRIAVDHIRVLAPQGTAARAIHGLLEQRRQWIEQALQQQQEQQLPPRSRQYCSGESWLLHGQHCQLQIELNPTSSSSTTIEHRDNRLLVQLAAQTDAADPEYRAQQIRQWYQQQAQQLWPPRLAHWAAITGLQPDGLKIRPYKSRWGGCHPSGLISLNTLLLMAPTQTQDYVMVHELCHLHHPNHGAAFWNLVQQYSPQPKHHRRWLREHRRHLVF